MTVDLMSLSLHQIKDLIPKLVFHMMEMDKILNIQMVKKRMMKKRKRRMILIVMTAMMKQWSQLLKILV